MSYTALVTHLNNYRKDENSERLYLADCFGEGVIVGSDVEPGELVLYMPTDGRLLRWFGDAFHLFKKNEDGTPQGGYIENNGHIKAIKLRGNQSSGVVLKVSEVYRMFGNQNWVDGDKVTTVNGKTFIKKYVPKQKVYHGQPKTSIRGKEGDAILYPEFDMHIDTDQLMYNLEQFHEGDIISMSVKMHGTSQRSMLTYGVLPNHGIGGFFRRLLHLPRKTVESYVLGTRRCVILPNPNGFYGNEEFRKQHHEALKSVIEPGMEVFYEVVGYYGPEPTQTIMGIGDNTKLKDKEFIKRFGDKTVFSYGCKVGESKAYVYRITSDNGNKEWTPTEIMTWVGWAQSRGVNIYCVPFFKEFIFTTKEDLVERVNKELADLVDPIGGHLKEGVVVRIVNRRTFTAYKAKTYEFKVLEGIIKDDEVAPDMEEAQDVEYEDN